MATYTKKIRGNLKIASLTNIEKTLDTYAEAIRDKLPKAFLEESCKWIIKEAQRQLQTYFPIDEGMRKKLGIKSSFDFKLAADNKSVRLFNSHNQAAFIEFGIGRVGENAPHAKAKEANWRYNVPSKAKDQMADNLDKFRAGGGDMSDMWWLEDGGYGAWWASGKNGAKERITQGEEATEFLYGALVKFKEQNIWQSIVSKVYYRAVHGRL